MLLAARVCRLPAAATVPARPSRRPGGLVVAMAHGGREDLSAKRDRAAGAGGRFSGGSVPPPRLPA